MLKKVPSQMVEVHGHRGSRGTHPENTFAAFNEAYDSKANAFELDTQLTQDGQVIVFHDFEISSRVCLNNGVPPAAPIAIEKLNLVEIRTWDCGSVKQPKFPNQILSKQEIPTLSETLEWLSRKAGSFYVNIEMKVAPQLDEKRVIHYADSVLQELTRFQLLDRCLIQSFDFRPLRHLRVKKTDLKLSCLFDEAVDFLAEATEVKANAIGPYFDFLSADIIEKAHEKGLKVIPWTVNSPGDWDRLIGWKVDGIITDYPRMLVEHLKT